MEKEEIKAIVFDIGDVLLKESGKASREHLVKKYKFDSKKFSEFAIKNLKKSYIGELHYRDFFKKLVKKLKINAKPDNLISSWVYIREKTSKIDKNIEKLIKKLRKKYLVTCLTNTTLLNDKVKARKNAYKLFNIKITSVQARAKKPEIKIYKILIKELKKKNISPEEAVFIDNEQQNLIPAKKLGMKTILFKNNKQLAKDLKKFGVNIK